MTDTKEVQVTTNALNHTVESFNITTFDEIVKDIRNARRALTDESNDSEVVAEALEVAKKEMEAAIRSNDMEGYNDKSGEVRRLMKKLGEGQQMHLTKFNKALNRLAELTTPVTAEKPALEEVPSKKAA